MLAHFIHTTGMSAGWLHAPLDSVHTLIALSYKPMKKVSHFPSILSNLNYLELFEQLPLVLPWQSYLSW